MADYFATLFAIIWSNIVSLLKNNRTNKTILSAVKAISKKVNPFQFLVIVAHKGVNPYSILEKIALKGRKLALYDVYKQYGVVFNDTTIQDIFNKSVEAYIIANYSYVANDNVLLTDPDVHAMYFFRASAKVKKQLEYIQKRTKINMEHAWKIYRLYFNLTRSKDITSPYVIKYAEARDLKPDDILEYDDIATFWLNNYKRKDYLKDVFSANTYQELAKEAKKKTTKTHTFKVIDKKYQEVDRNSKTFNYIDKRNTKPFVNECKRILEYIVTIWANDPDNFDFDATFKTIEKKENNVDYGYLYAKSKEIFKKIKEEYEQSKDKELQDIVDLLTQFESIDAYKKTLDEFYEAYETGDSEKYLIPLYNVASIICYSVLNIMIDPQRKTAINYYNDLHNKQTVKEFEDIIEHGLKTSNTGCSPKLIKMKADIFQGMRLFELLKTQREKISDVKLIETYGTYGDGFDLVQECVAYILEAGQELTKNSKISGDWLQTKFTWCPQFKKVYKQVEIPIEKEKEKITVYQGIYRTVKKYVNNNKSAYTNVSDNATIISLDELSELISADNFEVFKDNGIISDEFDSIESFQELTKTEDLLLKIEQKFSHDTGLAIVGFDSAKSFVDFEEVKAKLYEGLNEIGTKNAEQAREIVEYRLQGKSERQIAKLMNLDVPKVKYRLHQVENYVLRKFKIDENFMKRMQQKEKEQQEKSVQSFAILKKDLQTGEILGEYPSLSSLEKETYIDKKGKEKHFQKSAIAQVCDGKRKSHGGFAWSYKDVEDINSKRKTFKYDTKLVPVIVEIPKETNTKRTNESDKMEFVFKETSHSGLYIEDCLASEMKYGVYWAKYCKNKTAVVIDRDKEKKKEILYMLHMIMQNRKTDTIRVYEKNDEEFERTVEFIKDIETEEKEMHEENMNYIGKKLVGKTVIYNAFDDFAALYDAYFDVYREDIFEVLKYCREWES